MSTEKQYKNAIKGYAGLYRGDENSDDLEIILRHYLGESFKNLATEYGIPYKKQGITNYIEKVGLKKDTNSCPMCINGTMDLITVSKSSFDTALKSVPEYKKDGNLFDRMRIIIERLPLKCSVCEHIDIPFPLNVGVNTECNCEVCSDTRASEDLRILSKHTKLVKDMKDIVFSQDQVTIGVQAMISICSTEIPCLTHFINYNDLSVPSLDAFKGIGTKYKYILGVEAIDLLNEEEKLRALHVCEAMCTLESTIISTKTVMVMFRVLKTITIHQLINLVYYANKMKNVDKYIQDSGNIDARMSPFSRNYRYIRAIKSLYDDLELEGDSLLSIVSTSKILEIIKDDSDGKLIPYDFEEARRRLAQED